MTAISDDIEDDEAVCFSTEREAFELKRLLEAGGMTDLAVRKWKKGDEFWRRNWD